MRETMPSFAQSLLSNCSKKHVISSLFAVLIVLLVAAYYRLEWKTVTGFVTAMDHGDVLFEDYVDHFYPMSREILSSDKPVLGYFYTAFFALFISPLGLLPGLTAVWLWGILQVVLTALLWAVPRRGLIRVTPGANVLYILLFITSVPVLHNFKWGQVSVLITLLVLGSFAAHQRNRRALSAVLLALAAAIKYYPALFAVYYLFKRDVRALVVFAVAAVILLVVIPAAVLTPDGLVSFQKESFAAFDSVKHWVARDVNSQYMPHVALRVLPIAATFETLELLIVVGWGVVCVVFGLLWVLQRKTRRTDPSLFAAGVFLCLPFLMRTSWPHYFVFLPFCQILILTRLWALRHRQRAWSLGLSAITLLSAVSSSAFIFNLFPHWHVYSSHGLYFAADLLALVALCGLVAMSMRVRTEEVGEGSRPTARCPA